ncbi:MAG: hypothetical protein ACI4R8_05225 [Candidatus Caccovivens sp.]
MIDTKSKLVLSILGKECKNGNYKIIEVSDIIMQLPRHFRMDSEAVKHILLHLERIDAISIKYDDDGVFCLAVLPYGFEILENDKPRLLKNTQNQKRINWLLVGLCFVCSLVGTILGIVVCYFLLKIF